MKAVYNSSTSSVRATRNSQILQC